MLCVWSAAASIVGLILTDIAVDSDNPVMCFHGYTVQWAVMCTRDWHGAIYIFTENGSGTSMSCLCENNFNVAMELGTKDHGPASHQDCFVYEMTDLPAF